MFNSLWFICFIRKKKKKDKDRELSKMYENIASHASTSESEDSKKKIQVDKRTKAEIAFEKSKEKKVHQNNQYIAVP